MKRQRPRQRPNAAKREAGPRGGGSGARGNGARGSGARRSGARGSDGGDDGADEHGSGDRLQKVLAAAGLGSRRDCEDLIREGRVEVDRKVVTELGTKVDPLQQEIRVDGEALRQAKRLYFAVNKPPGVVTTNFDPSGRPRVIDLVPTEERVFAVGRLDRSSEGLILVTNDGEFSNRITHPRYGVEKTYLVRVAGAPDQRQLARLKKGVHLAEGFARAQSIVTKKSHGQSTDLVIILNEGRNREIRRILARVGHKVLALKRTAVGPIKLGDLPPGGWRRLMPDEVESLLRVAKQKRREERRGAIAGGGDSRAPTRSVSKGRTAIGRPSEDTPRESASPPEPYLQKQALLSKPLSLDDLLSDDLDEGPIMHDAGDGGITGDSAGGTKAGGVIDYGDEDAAPGSEGPTTERPAIRPPRAERPRTGAARTGATGNERAHTKSKNGKPTERNQRREFTGGARGEKKVFGHREGGTGGQKGGKVGFRPKRAKPTDKPQGTDNQRRGKRRGGAASAKFGKGGHKPGGKPSGGKRGGRR